MNEAKDETMIDEEAAAAAVEKEVAEILKPFGEGRQRPSVTLVGPPTLPHVDASPVPPEGLGEAIQPLDRPPPSLSVTERLTMLDTQNAELRQLINERYNKLEQLIERHVYAIEAKLDAILTTLR
jgi:hypothetical protein